MDSPRHIRRLISQGEHQTLDFKFELSDARKIARSLVAFANTDGGRLLVGVKDNGKIVGVDSEEEMYMVEAAAQVFSTPEIPIEARLHEVEEKSVLEVIVIPAQVKHYVKELDGRDIAYVRKDDMNLKANPVMVKMWRMSKEEKGKKFDYGEMEQKLFDYIKEHGSISFKKYCKITRQHYRKATERLARLILWEVLDMDFSEKGTLYRINQESQPIWEKAMTSESEIEPNT